LLVSELGTWGALSTAGAGKVIDLALQRTGALDPMTRFPIASTLAASLSLGIACTSGSPSASPRPASHGDAAVETGPTADASDVSRDGGHAISLQWHASTTPGVTYDVFRAFAHGGPYTELQSGLTTTSARDTTVTAGAHYYYVVRSQDSNGQSTSSNEVDAVVP
jgi:large repetitive protein